MREKYLGLAGYKKPFGQVISVKLSPIHFGLREGRWKNGEY